MEEEKLKLEELLKEDKSRGLIYEAFQKYDEAYQKNKPHTDEEKGDYMELYFKFLEHMNKARWEKK